MENTSENDIALVMNIEPSEAKSLLAQAEADIEKELRRNVFIIEDEPNIAADIEGLVEDLSHTVDNIAASRSDVVKAAAEKKPGIVLADVQLAMVVQALMRSQIYLRLRCARYIHYSVL